MPAEKLSHKIRMPNSAAKRQCSSFLVLTIVFQNHIRPGSDRKGFFQLICHITAVRHGDPRVVGGIVVNSVIVKRNQVILVDRFLQVYFIYHIVFTELEDILIVHTVRSRGKPQHETGFEVIDNSLVTLGGDMVEFVNDDIVEIVGFEVGWIQILRLGKRLH